MLGTWWPCPGFGDARSAGRRLQGPSWEAGGAVGSQGTRPAGVLALRCASPVAQGTQSLPSGSRCRALSVVLTRGYPGAPAPRWLQMGAHWAPVLGTVSASGPCAPLTAGPNRRSLGCVPTRGRRPPWPPRPWLRPAGLSPAPGYVCARASPGQCSGTHPAACTHRATHAGGGRPPRPRPAAPHQPRRRLRGAARPTRRSASRERDPDRRVRQRGLRRDRRAARLRLLLPAVLQVRAAGRGQRWARASGRRARPRRAPPALSVCLRAGLSLFLFFSFFFIECFTFLQRQTFFL